VFSVNNDGEATSQPNDQQAADSPDNTERDRVFAVNSEGEVTPQSNDQQQAGGKGGSSRSRGIKGLLTRRTAVTGGIAGLVVGGILGIGGITSGPLQFLQVSQFMKIFHHSPSESLGDKFSGRFVVYALAGKAARGRMGLWGNQRADRWASRFSDNGMRPLYQAGTQRGIGFQVTDPVKAKPTLDRMRAQDIDVNGSFQSAVDIDGNPVNGARGVVTQDMPFRDRNRITRAATKALKVNRISAWMGARLHIKRGGTDGLFHPFRNRFRQTADRFALSRDQRRQEKEKLRDEEANRHRTGGADIDVNTTRLGRLRQKFSTALRTARGPAAAVALVCAAKGFSESIDAQNLESQLTMIRMGLGAVAMGDQIKSFEDLSIEEMGVYAEHFYDQETDTSWAADSGIQAASGNGAAAGVDLLSANGLKPGSRERPALLDAVDRITTRVEIGGVGVGPDACDLINETGDFINNLPGVGRVQSLVDGAINLALSPTGRTKDEWIQWLRDRYASQIASTAAKGAMWGGIVNVGNALAAREQMRMTGGSELSTTEARAVRQLATEERMQDLANASLYERYLNIFNADSLAATTLMKVPRTRTEAIATIARLPNVISSAIAAPFAGSRAIAQDANGYDYGFATVGFTEAEQDDPRFENPFEVGNYFEDHPDELERLNNEYGDDCHAMTITREGNLRYSKAGEEDDLVQLPAKCHADRGREEVLRYRYYLAYTLNVLALDCYEGLDEGACDQLYGQADSEVVTPAGSPALDAGGCPQAPVPESETVVVQGVRVHRCIGGRIDQLLTEAHAAGVNLAGGGWRDTADQIRLRTQNGCRDVWTASPSTCRIPTAIPGKSMHERGLAIDFTLNGGTVRRGDAGWNWLVANAARFGLSNLPSESWHWSTSGG